MLFNCFQFFFKRTSTLGTKLEVLGCRISTIGTPLELFMTAGKTQFIQIQVYMFSGSYGSSSRIIKHRCFTAASHSYVIPFIPFEQGYEKKHKICICHIHFHLSISSTATANGQLLKIQLLFLLTDSHYKKHTDSPPNLVYQ